MKQQKVGSILEQQQSSQKQVSGNAKINIECNRKMKSGINIDCIKVCPMDTEIWALSFYQQHPQFVGGIQIKAISQFQSQEEGNLGEGVGYVEMGPIMHIQWLNTKDLPKNNNKYFILAVARCDEAIICSFNKANRSFNIEKKVKLENGVFCLYGDWRLKFSKQNGNEQKTLNAIAAVSTNQSTVFCFDISITQQSIQVSQTNEYKKHEYAVWACKINPSISVPARMIAGDEVNCLYLYDLQNSQLLAKNKSAHTQGICQIYWKYQEWVLTGSFDGTIAQINVNDFAHTLRIFKLGGTVWRIIAIPCPIQQKQLDRQQLYLICNSSDKKFQILSMDQDKTIWDSGQEHESLAYAADVCASLMVTTSFYDKKLRAWQYQLK